eukprot:scaffold41346_cov21-Tisochrysis_lutea.AAC.2
MGDQRTEGVQAMLYSPTPKPLQQKNTMCFSACAKVQIKKSWRIATDKRISCEGPCEAAHQSLSASRFARLQQYRLPIGSRMITAVHKSQAMSLCPGTPCGVGGYPTSREVRSGRRAGKGCHARSASLAHIANLGAHFTDQPAVELV